MLHRIGLNWARDEPQPKGTWPVFQDVLEVRAAYGMSRLDADDSVEDRWLVDADMIEV